MRSYTPLRYPGGKVKLYDFTANLISNNFETPPIYAEAFAGGSGLALKLLSHGIVSKIYINDFDYAIYSFWYSLKYDNTRFQKAILDAQFTIEEWDKQKEIYLTANLKTKSPYSKFLIGFATFYLNRTNRSGILTAGPIGGRMQNGNYLMDCRFNKESLIKIVKNFNRLKKNIHVYHRDAQRFIQQMDKDHENIIIYLDPPYVQKGPELYKNSFDAKKHNELRDSVNTLDCKWFMTYDNDALIKELYRDYDIQTFELNYSIHSSKTGKEYAIFSDNIVVSDNIKKI